MITLNTSTSTAAETLSDIDDDNDDNDSDFSINDCYGIMTKSNDGKGIISSSTSSTVSLDKMSDNTSDDVEIG